MDGYVYLVKHSWEDSSEQWVVEGVAEARRSICSAILEVLHELDEETQRHILSLIARGSQEALQEAIRAYENASDGEAFEFAPVRDLTGEHVRARALAGLERLKKASATPGVN